MKLASHRGSALLALALTGVTFLLMLGVAAYSALELGRFERLESRRAVVLYAAGQTLSRGTNVRMIGLAATLGRLGYTETRGMPTVRGQFRRTGGGWDIVLRDGGGRIGVELQGERIVRVIRDGKDAESAALEGEVLTGGRDQPGEDYRPIQLAAAPKVLVDAVLAAEDHRFFQHGAVDVRALARATWANLTSGRVIQGGSTITQQLVKNRLLTPERTVLRKLREALLAKLVETRYTKQQILEAYLNEAYFGQRGPLALRGVGAASRAYFGKEVHQLKPGEAALLAGMLRAPNTYSPVLHPERARERRDTVLTRMRDLGMLDAAAYDRARREPLRSLPRPWPGQAAPYFADLVREELEARSLDVTRVDTTLDLTLQRFAENAVARGLDQLETRYPRLGKQDPRGQLQVALVAVDPATGEIRALVGGRSYEKSQFNHVTLARRQAGSAFKPFVYAAALKPRDGAPRFTAASMIDDAPLTLTVDGEAWSPHNYEGRYEGHVSVRRALEQSLNGATVRISQAVGLPLVVETAAAFGFDKNLAPRPAIALGALEVTPLDLARAYATFADGGIRPGAMHTVHAAYQADGTQARPTGDSPATVVMSPAEAYLMTSLLEGVVRSGTASSASALGVPAEIAGKTGTTNEGRDAWFVGYSSRLLAVVWVGFDDGRPHGLSGAQAALPIWADFMRQALGAYPSPAFTVPNGISFADVDATNGKLARSSCPLVIRETFLAGTEPERCEEHLGLAERFLDWTRRLRDWLRR
ncbi:MAG TPA: PBP1A family penicillin-binding protein [Candidatus Bathyarchaeia archaeon]|nr:PBP1A family penicillin-binding protein [Candidatus Bathyarchaeia archaeon]